MYVHAYSTKSRHTSGVYVHVHTPRGVHAYTLKPNRIINQKRREKIWKMQFMKIDEFAAKYQNGEKWQPCRVVGVTEVLADIWFIVIATNDKGNLVAFTTRSVKPC